VIQDRTSKFPKAFTELTLRLSDALKFFMRFFKWQDMESVIFLASLVAKKSIACLTLSEKITSQAAWVVA